MKDGLLYKIYSLTDPRTNEVFYVGRTTNDLKTRLSGHLAKASKSGNEEKFKRICEIQEQGLKPTIALIETTQNPERELFVIEEYRKSHPLLNRNAYGRRFTPGVEPEDIVELPELFREMVKCETFLKDYFPEITSVKHRLNGKSSRGKPLGFTKAQVEQIIDKFYEVAMNAEI